MQNLLYLQMNQIQPSKIKLLIGINAFDMTGAPRLIVDEINNLDRTKYQLVLLTFFEVGAENNFFDLLPDEVTSYKLNFKNFYDIKNWFKLCKILKEYKPNMVLSHLFFSNTVLRILKPFFKYKIVIYEHNTYTKKTRLQVLIDRILSRLTYKIIAVSGTVKQFTANQEKINSEKFVVLSDSINYHHIQSKIEGCDKDELKQKLGFKKEDKLIINAAKFNWQKNHQLLIDSFAEFSKQNSDYKLIILGNGVLWDFFNQYIKKIKMEDRIFLLGRQKNILDYMFISEFFLLTSKIEGFCIACIEAMAIGLPVVSTNVAGPDEYIVNGFNGYLVKSDNKEEIDAAMQKVADQGRNSFSDNCRQTAQNYDVKEHIKGLEAIIRQ